MINVPIVKNSWFFLPKGQGKSCDAHPRTEIRRTRLMPSPRVTAVLILERPSTRRILPARYGHPVPCIDGIDNCIEIPV